uniref:HGWP repeat containing protein-like n=1 Tax=Oryza sativa subsp. japonica TaxID=39947 RepID=Q5VMS6_ORYSJ|nr:HGWP repeat containing protein-like [Oryza sativa Japonica Group]
MNHEKFWNGSITGLPQPSLSQPKGASWSKRSSQAVPSGKVLLEVRQDATEEVRQEEKTAQPIFLLASSNLGDEILVRGHLLSAVAAVLRLAAAAAPLLLPTRRHLPRHRRIAVDLVRASVSLADRRSTVVIVIPSRAAVSLRSGRRSRRRRCPGTPQLRKIRSSWKLKPSFGKASKARHIILIILNPIL